MEKLIANPEVCFFDSGIGGINLLYECVRKLPCVDFTYFADNFRVPYGSLALEELRARVDSFFEKINMCNPSAAVIACNTVTAQCIGYLRKKYKFPIVGIQPAVKPAAAMGRCLVLATPSTAQSDALKEITKKYGNDRTEIFACEDLAAYVEENVFYLSEKRIASFLPSVETDTVVLGCTHYVFCKDIIKNFYKCTVFDGIEATADHLCKILGNFDHQTNRAQKIIFSDGDTDKNRCVFNYIMVKNGRLSQQRDI